MTIQARDMQVHEILTEVSKQRTDDLKVELLRVKYSDHVPLQRILKMNFCDTIIPILPDGTPPFNREKIDGPSRASLWAYAKNFAYFVRSAQSAKLKPLQVEKIFIEMLEAVDPEEADMICMAKDKKLTDKWDMSVDVVKAAFPQLNITNKAPVVPPTPEQIEKNRQATIQLLKDRAKKLQEEAKEILAQAKELEKA